MTNKEGATPLAQGSPKAKDHGSILPAFEAAVKAQELKSALELLKMEPKEAVSLLREQFPSFDKTVLYKCSKPEKYGCVLHPAGYSLLRALAVEADESQEAPPEQPKKRYRHKLTRQVSGRLPERKYDTLQHYLRLDGWETIQDWVTAQVDIYIGRMAKKYGNPGASGDSEH